MVGGVGEGVADYGLTEEQQGFLESVRRVAGDLADVEPVHGAVNRPLVARLGELGLLRALFGGEAVRRRPAPGCRGDAALPPPRGPGRGEHRGRDGAGAAGARLLPDPPVGERRHPRPLAAPRGERHVVPAFALSEPDAGSDAGALALEARPDGDGWTLHGTKTWISNAPDADVYSVFARTTPGAKARGVTAFAVAGDSPGLTGDRLDMIAPHALGTLHLDGVRVSRDDLLGEVDQGFGVAMRTLDLFRPSVGAFAVGMAQAALDASLAWAQERELFGGRLIDQQATQHTLAEMSTRIEAGRLLVRRAAAAYDAGAPPTTVTTTAAQAKLFATETAQWVVDQAVQLHGARALQRGHLLERLYREVRAPRIYEGASEVQRTIIARGLRKGTQ